MAVAEPEPIVQPVWTDGPVEETVTIAGDVLPANVLDDPENGDKNTGRDALL